MGSLRNSRSVRVPTRLDIQGDSASNGFREAEGSGLVRMQDFFKKNRIVMGLIKNFNIVSK